MYKHQILEQIEGLLKAISIHNAAIAELKWQVNDLKDDLETAVDLSYEMYGV